LVASVEVERGLNVPVPKQLLDDDVFTGVGAQVQIGGYMPVLMRREMNADMLAYGLCESIS